MRSAGVRRFPLVWAGLGLEVASGVLTGLTEVGAARAGALALTGVLLVVFGVAVAASRLPAHEALPPPVVALSAFVVLAGCVWTLAAPNDEGVDGIHAGLAGLLGQGDLGAARAGTWSTVAWTALLLGAVAGVANWRLSVTAARRREHAQAQQTT